MDRSLNITEPQVLFHFPGDADGLNYHHRVLIHKIGGGRWIVLSPDMELSVADMNNQRHTVLARNARFPEDIEDECYTFDGLSRNELERQKKLARTMGSILDDSADVAGVDSLSWIVADPSSGKFGQPLPPEMADDVVVVGTHGLVEWDGDTHYVREVETSKVAEFKNESKEASNDIRTIGDHRDSQGKRYLSHSEAISLLRESKVEDWCFSGPRSTLEFCKSVLAGPGDFTSYHMAWTRNSGVGGNSAIAHEHKSICEAIRLALVRDQIDISNLMSFEHLVRRMVILEIAVSRNPAAPDFSGLDVVSEAPVTQGGSAQVTALNSWVTERLKERANIQKQARLFREEYGKIKKTGEQSEETDKRRWPNKRGKKAESGGAPGPAAGS